MSNKLDFLHKIHTCDLVDLPPAQSAASCKWVYQIKTTADRIVEQYKAHLVAKGFILEYSIKGHQIAHGPWPDLEAQQPTKLIGGSTHCYLGSWVAY